MADHGHELTDEILADLEKRLRKEYEQAAKETQEKLDKYMKKFKTKDAIWKKSVEAGIKSQEEYDEWRLQAIAAGDRWEKMKDRIVSDQLHTNQIAREIMNKEMPGIFEMNANFALYQVEHDSQIDTSLTLYNREAVDRILRDNPEMLLPPGKRVSEQIRQGKAERWERNKVQSVMTQGILQGESIPKLASRLASAVADSDYKAAVRNARTMATNAQNAGRYDAYNQLESNGVELTLEWAATLDNRTRHTHRMMHGQRRSVGEPFEVDGVKIMYPAQTGSFMGISNLPQELIWNCRCTILAYVKGYEHDTIKHSDKMGKMTFEEWLEAKPKPQNILHQKNLGEQIEGSYIKEYRKMSKEADEILAGRAVKTNKATSVKELPKEVQEALHSYTDGHYADICEYTQYVHAGGIPSMFYKTREKWEEQRLPNISEKDRDIAEQIYKTIIDQPTTDNYVVRLERGASNAVEGDLLNFGVRSTSSDADFIKRIENGEMEGFDFDLLGKNNNGDWTELRFVNSKKLDISDVSAYKDQKENLIAGRYKVVKTETVEAQKEDYVEKETPIADVAQNVSHFVSKKGKEMVRYTYDGKEMTDTLEKFNSRKVVEYVDIPAVFGRKIITLEYADE